MANGRAEGDGEDGGHVRFPCTYIPVAFHVQVRNRCSWQRFWAMCGIWATGKDEKILPCHSFYVSFCLFFPLPYVVFLLNFVSWEFLTWILALKHVRFAANVISVFSSPCVILMQPLCALLTELYKPHHDSFCATHLLKAVRVDLRVGVPLPPWTWKPRMLACLGQVGMEGMTPFVIGREYLANYQERAHLIWGKYHLDQNSMKNVQHFWQSCSIVSLGAREKLSGCCLQLFPPPVAAHLNLSSLAVWMVAMAGWVGLILSPGAITIPASPGA